MKKMERTVTAENQFSDAVELHGFFNVSISGKWIGKITCQRSFDKGSTWFDVKSWTDNSQEYGFEPERGIHYRIGVKAGEHESGAAILRLSQ